MPNVDEPLLALLGFVAATVLVVVDGRNAVGIAAMVCAACLAPSVAESTDGTAALVVVAAGLLAAVMVPLGRFVARRTVWLPGLDPVVPVVTVDGSLFGPRSIRVACGAAVLPAASWVSFNVPVGNATTVTGILFPAAIVWSCAAVRLLLARTVVDIAVGVAAVGIAGAVGWLAAEGPTAVPGALAVASLAPALGLAAGWLSGRHAVGARPA